MKNEFEYLGMSKIGRQRLARTLDGGNPHFKMEQWMSDAIKAGNKRLTIYRISRQPFFKANVI